MHTHLATQLAGSKDEVLDLIRGAALVVLERHGQVQSTSPLVKAAYVAGFLVAYFQSEPGNMARRGRGNWNTPEGGRKDPLQHVIDIRVGEQVVGLGWRGDGPIRTDVFVRGPWEFELLKAAEFGIVLPPGTIRPAPAAPESRSRWKTAFAPDYSVYAMSLSRTLTFTVVGYKCCHSDVAEAGTDFLDLRNLVAGCYARSRIDDGEAYAEGSPSSCFVLECRMGDRRRDGRPPVGRPEFSYLIGSDDGLTTATLMLLQFDICPSLRRTGSPKVKGGSPAIARTTGARRAPARVAVR